MRGFHKEAGGSFMSGTDDKSTYRVERSATISASPAAIYALLADFHEWPKWSPWEEIDPDVYKRQGHRCPHSVDP